ncbi:unnamed protein product, partial [Clonostachys rhizophaga]
ALAAYDMNVAVVGATGETGQSIINGLKESSTSFNITALVRTVDTPEIHQLNSRGIATVAVDLEGPYEDVVKSLSGQEVVICAINPFCVSQQITLANAASEAKVKRFVPSAFGPVCPPRGVMALRELKEEVISHVKKIHLPYTVIDVGWWYQSSIPKLPSGKIDYAVTFGMSRIVEDGRQATCITDLRDIGRYVALVIVDERTINKYVFAYNELESQESIFRQLEAASGEKIPRIHTTNEEVLSAITTTRKPYDEGNKSFLKIIPLVLAQYPYSLWVRGDNVPEKAQYLGYLSSKQLYPEFNYVPFASYIQEVYQGKGRAVYSNRRFGFTKP